MSENTRKKSVLLYQIILIPICIAVGYIFSSLQFYNKVNYVEISSVLSHILSKMLIISIVLYAIMTVIFHFNLHYLIKNIIKIFESHYTPPRVSIYASIIFFVFYSLYLAQPCDYPAHTDWAINALNWQQFNQFLISVPYPLWHIMVSLVNKILYIPPVYAAALVSAGFEAYEYIILYNIIYALNPDSKHLKNNLLAMNFAMVLMFVQPIYVPWFNEYCFLGQGTPNIWDNPTQVAAQPFALITTYLFIRIVFHNDYSTQPLKCIDFIRMGFYLLVSVLAKPSFFQIFVPGAIVFLFIKLIKSHGASFALSIKIALSFLPAGFWCLAIFILSFITTETIATSGGNGIGIGFMEVWSLYSKNIPFSIFLGSTFPITYLVLANKKVNRPKIIFFVSLCYIFGILEYLLLKETGPRMPHANFGWGYRIGVLLMYAFAGSDYVTLLSKERKNNLKPAVLIPSIVLTLNVLFGIEYYVKLWRHIIPF